jgi:hypothetical protein
MSQRRKSKEVRVYPTLLAIATAWTARRLGQRLIEKTYRFERTTGKSLPALQIFHPFGIYGF